MLTPSCFQTNNVPREFSLRLTKVLYSNTCAPWRKSVLRNNRFSLQNFMFVGRHFWKHFLSYFIAVAVLIPYSCIDQVGLRTLFPAASLFASMFHQNWTGQSDCPTCTAGAHSKIHSGHWAILPLLPGLQKLPRIGLFRSFSIRIFSIDLENPGCHPPRISCDLPGPYSSSVRIQPGQPLPTGWLLSLKTVHWTFSYAQPSPCLSCWCSGAQLSGGLYLCNSCSSDTAFCIPSSHIRLE